jgi:two-component system OmpR family response regulator
MLHPIAGYTTTQSSKDQAIFGTSRASGAMRLLVVDDDPVMRDMIVNYLAENGLQADAAAGRDEMATSLQHAEYDLVILDLKLGQDDGLDLLRELRTRSDLPVIIITGHRRDEIDRVVGLELGADDYVTKPFNLRELLARVRVILRRAEAARVAARREAQAGPEAKAGGWRSYRFGGWRLDRRTRQLHNPDGERVTLTNSEHTLLVAFLDAPQRPLSREQLLQATRMHENIYDRSIDVQILRLRRKLETDTSTPRMIQTERGVGYVFALPVERV